MTRNYEAGTCSQQVRPQIKSNARCEFSTRLHSPVKVWPAVGSIKRQVLECLLSGDTLTSLQAWAQFGTSRLAALIHQLRCEGWDIASERIEVDTKAGRSAFVAEYRIGGA
jgi:hypothetical protein